MQIRLTPVRAFPWIFFLLREYGGFVFSSRVLFGFVGMAVLFFRRGSFFSVGFVVRGRQLLASVGS